MTPEAEIVERCARAVHRCQYGTDDPGPHAVSDVWSAQVEIVLAVLHALAESEPTEAQAQAYLDATSIREVWRAMLRALIEGASP